MTDTSAPLGPVDFALVAFPGNRFKGEIVPALKELVDNGTIRILDLVFVEKDDDGSVLVVELDEADDETTGAFDDLEGEGSELLSDGDLELAAESLEPGSSALLLGLGEHLGVAHGPRAAQRRLPVARARADPRRGGRGRRRVRTGDPARIRRPSTRPATLTDAPDRATSTTRPGGTTC